MSKGNNRLRWFFQEKLLPSQRKVLMDKMVEEWKISERTLMYDLNHGNTPPWRRILWAKELGNVLGVLIDESEVYPEPYSAKESESEEVKTDAKKVNVK